MASSTTVGDVRVEIAELDDGQERDRFNAIWSVTCYWTPHKAEHALIVGSGAGYAMSSLHSSIVEMLQHAYAQGRVDAALGF